MDNNTRTTRLESYPNKTIIQVGETATSHILDMVDDVVNSIGDENEPFHGSIFVNGNQIEIQPRKFGHN